jgi:septal ring factor EnvC (AmiA/AmiB activator)
MSEAPPAYYEILSEAPPAYSDASVDLAAQLEQMKAQVHQMEEMKQMMASLLKAEAARKADKDRKAEAARKVDEMREAEIARKEDKARKAAKEQNILIAARMAEMTRREDEKRKAEAKRRAEELSKWRKEEEHRKAEEERKQREVAEHPMRQEEARKRSAARIQAGEFSIWNRRETQMGPTTELITGRGNHVWSSDRTPITIDGKVCVGPRLGDYWGINWASIHFSMCGISRNGTTINGVTYDGTVEPKLY